MKSALPIICLLTTLSTYGQDKYNYNIFNRLRPIDGTPYVLTSIDNLGKMGTVHREYLLFINTKNGQANPVDFGENASLHNWEQFKFDSLGVNTIVLTARTVTLDKNRRIDWNDPIQVIVISPDGKQKKQLTDDRFFTVHHVVHRETGVIVINGYYDTNNNGKHDKTDKDEIVLFDLKTWELIAKR
ncbi:hypothetical protein WJU16_19525 [Chitinophaga pollutisoli]|uniref:Uncharacterized protein n=1 Tax=Chitinophaga pollutisoli TaxID=3133966 RepID=A0ABZ2YLJ8_9BACT